MGVQSIRAATGHVASSLSAVSSVLDDPVIRGVSGYAIYWAYGQKSLH
jgi:hypothetical protein